MLQYLVQDMSCQHCVKVITQAVTKAVPGAQVDIDLARQLVRVDHVGDDAKITDAIREAGYTPVSQAKE